MDADGEIWKKVALQSLAMGAVYQHTIARTLGRKQVEACRNAARGKEIIADTEKTAQECFDALKFEMNFKYAREQHKAAPSRVITDVEVWEHLATRFMAAGMVYKGLLETAGADPNELTTVYETEVTQTELLEKCRSAIRSDFDWAKKQLQEERNPGGSN